MTPLRFQGRAQRAACVSNRDTLGADLAADQLSAYAHMWVHPTKEKDAVFMLCKPFLLGAGDNQD